MEIYKITEDDWENGETYELSLGTLKECAAAMDSWICENCQDHDNDESEDYSCYKDEEEFYKLNPDIKLFIDDPEKWVDENGESEIYNGWELEHVYTSNEGSS